jgi:hypothetical protein
VQETVLAKFELDDLESIALSYFGQETLKSEPQWQSTWRSNVTLPSLIRVQVRLANGAEWPDFLVAPLFARGPSQ